MANKKVAKRDWSQSGLIDAQRNSATLPTEHAIDYESLLLDAQLQGASIASHLCQHLPEKWRALYVAAVSRATNIVRFSRHSFDYMVDLYSELEAVGETPYDQTVEDRVVAVLGISALPRGTRGTRSRGWLIDTGELVSLTRDKGHFIAHCIGGGLEANVYLLWVPRLSISTNKAFKAASIFSCSVALKSSET